MCKRRGLEGHHRTLEVNEIKYKDKDATGLFRVTFKVDANDVK